MERNRYLDLLRVGAIGLVVVGHWLLTDVTYTRGQLSGLDALDYLSWMRWLTLLFQVMPVFFLVGGYVNASSWTRHHDAGEGWARWVRHAAHRRWGPSVPVAMTAGAAAVDVAILGPHLPVVGFANYLLVWGSMHQW